MTPDPDPTRKLPRARELIARLCERALAAKLGLEELHEHAPAGAAEDPFLREVFADLCDAVEHVPGKWLSRQIDYEAWYASEQYLVLYLDCKLLGLELRSEELLKRRNAVLELPQLSRDIIDQKLS